MSPVSGRAGAVLGRFPCHLEVGDGGKRFGSVVVGLADELDVTGHEIGQVRRSHRLSEAPTTLDLVRLSALHGLGEPALEPLDVRHRALAAADTTDHEALARMTALSGADLAVADAAELAADLETLVTFTTRLDRQRDAIADLIVTGRDGSGTSRTILAATAAMLGFELLDVSHDSGRWWHLGTCRDRVVPGLAGIEATPEVIAVEENPFVDASTTPVLRRHGDRFEVLRGGLEDITVSTVVVGTGARTVAPMVVNVDAGTGVFFDGTVPEGQELVFAFWGQVLLDGTEATGRAVGFEGGVFADAEAEHQNDFVFTEPDGALPPDPAQPSDRAATFVTTTPIVDGFDPGASLPHGGGVVPAMPMAIGRSRWGFFVRTAHFGSDTGPAVPTFGSGLFDESVLTDADGPLEPSGSVGFRWEEREPFSVRVHLPARLAEIDDDTGSLIRQPIRRLLDRYRAAGVRLTTTYADSRWVLGSGYARTDETSGSLGIAIGGTELWPDGTTQPTSP